METTKKYSSAVRDDVYEWTKEVKDVNILVGIPCL
jgi:glucosylglycerate synthase